jgi:hypothetical protein
MDLSREAEERHQLGDASDATHELMQRIVKLRWMGLDDEAELVRSTLYKAEPGVTWVVGPCDTD